MKSSKKQKMHRELVDGLDELHNLRSILSVLSQDHDELRKQIEVLKSGSKDLARKKEAYKIFSKLLKSHAKCEEKAVYEIALKFKDLKAETFEAYGEHEVAAFMMKKIAKISNKDEWMGNVKVLAEAVEHHIIEEENDFLPELKKKLESNDELPMVDDFIKRRERFKIQPPAKHNGVLTQVGVV
jgi:hemerythrin superfamily protein